MDEIGEFRTHIISQELLDEEQEILQSLADIEKSIDEFIQKISDSLR